MVISAAVEDVTQIVIKKINILVRNSKTIY